LNCLNINLFVNDFLNVIDSLFDLFGSLRTVLGAAYEGEILIVVVMIGVAESRSSLAIVVLLGGIIGLTAVLDPRSEDSLHSRRRATAGFHLLNLFKLLLSN
jgi:hypothetical protein